MTIKLLKRVGCDKAVILDYFYFVLPYVKRQSTKKAFLFVSS